MTVLNGIELDKIWIIYSMWQNKFFEPRVKVGATLVWKLWKNRKLKKKIEKNKKQTKIS